MIEDGKLEIMNIEDYNQIISLWEKTEVLGKSSADEKENLIFFLQRNPELNYVYKINNIIVGTILCGHDGRRGYIYHLTVDKNFRNQGIANLLINKSLSQLEELNINKCHLFVFKKNDSGINFWNKNGWEKRNDILMFSKLL